MSLSLSFQIPRARPARGNALAESPLGDLARRLLPLSNPGEMTAVACEILVNQLALSDAAFCAPAGLPEALGPDNVAALHGGQEVVSDHTLTIPLVRDGRLVAACHLRVSRERRWSQVDMQLAHDVAQWTWCAVDNAAAQAALRRERDECQHTFDNMAEGFAIIDPDWRVVQMNAAGLRSSHRAAEQVIGRNHWEVWPETVGSELQATCQRVMATGLAETVRQEVKLGRGEVSLFDIHVQRRPGDSLVIFFRDITQQEHAASALRDADRRKDEFFAMLAHELRNPLAPIAMAAEMLKHPGLDQASIQNVSALIQRQSRHISALLADLLDMSRINLGLVTLDTTPLSLDEILTDAIEQTRPLMVRKAQEFKYLACPQPLRIDGDENRMVQVFANILNNASKYTPAGGSINLAVRVAEGQAIVTVSDTGDGMSDDLIPNVFDIFTQAQRSSDRMAGGLGLGLSLVKNLVLLQGGTVRACSAGLGQGSDFIVTFPLCLPPAQPAAPSLTVKEEVDNFDASLTLAALQQARSGVAAARVDQPRV